MQEKLFIGGAHRGGRAITDEALRLLSGPESYSEVIVADPKEDRAQELARIWKRSGVSAEGKNEPCEKAIVKADADAVMLTIDTIAPMAKILEKNSLPTQWQLLCRGLGENSPVIGICGSVHEGGSGGRAASASLIKELGSFIRPQSSSAIRQNPLNADFLHVMRRRVSEHSAHRLAVLDREPKDLANGPLNFFWGPSYYPLLIQEKPAKARWMELKEQVASAEMPPYLRNAPVYAIATVGRKNVDFFVVEEARGRRTIRFHMPLVQALPKPTGSVKQNIAAGAVGADTGMGLVASLLAAAVVTD